MSSKIIDFKNKPAIVLEEYERKDKTKGYWLNEIKKIVLNNKIYYLEILFDKRQCLIKQRDSYETMIHDYFKIKKS